MSLKSLLHLLTNASIFAIMARDKQLKQLRDQNLRNRYEELSKKHPQWRHGALLEKVAQEFFLTARTAAAIFNHEGIYSQSA